MKKIFQHIKEEWYKYLLEIIVIALSIFAGLELENWNERRKERQLELSYLRRLQSDLVSDTIYYNQRILQANELREHNVMALERIYEGFSDLEDVRELFALIRLYAVQLTNQDGTYTEMANAGHLNIISDEHLKLQISDLYREIAIAKEHYKELNNTSIEIQLQWHNLTRASKLFSLVEDSPYKPNMYSYHQWQWLNEPDSDGFELFESMLGTYYFKHGLFQDYAEDLKTRTSIVLDDISNVLSSEGP